MIHFLLRCCLLLCCFFNPATSSGFCFESRCGGDYQTIRFPFRIENRQPKSCGYPGFDLSCQAHPTGQDQPLLHLPPSGDFSVKYIDYRNQEIWINDPNNCLAGKILSLNLSGSPFVAKNSQDFTFFNCSADYSPSWLIDPIYCLGSSSHAVFASSSPATIDILSSNCVVIKTVSVPVSWSFWPKLWDDLLLRWENPACGSCESLGGGCELKPNSSSRHEIQCTNIPQAATPSNSSSALSMAVGVVAAVLCFLILLCCLCARLRSRPRNSSPETHWTVSSQPTTTMGLDGPTIDSYPNFVLGQSLRLPEPNNNICPICLSQYRPKEILKSIPNCQHCFHQHCIEEWLRLNASCPVCRKSPFESLPSIPP
ncbi:putative RING-H2 finger protein ATL21B [Momordica charantia]|uniref:RING-type E3 ubiquitin transferase n=1 Tax=Momordica charantia TaxID=3673 RepID=A0A6J1CJI6_MOMCH|nr:putative RING-H2 finger protein ATL21B [Momordica charantia]